MERGLAVMRGSPIESRHSGYDPIAVIGRTAQSSGMRLAVAFISIVALSGCEMRTEVAQDDRCQISVPTGWRDMSKATPLDRQAVRTTYADGHYVWGHETVNLQTIGMYLKMLKSFNPPPIVLVVMRPSACDEIARLVETTVKSGYCGDTNCAFVAGR